MWGCLAAGLALTAGLERRPGLGALSGAGRPQRLGLEEADLLDGVAAGSGTVTALKKAGQRRAC